MNRLKSRLIIALVAMVPASALSAIVVPDSASAASCASGTGVSVVVGSQVRCAAGGGRSAASAFGATGHSLTRVQRQPGFVCQVDGYPDSSCVNTPPSNAYWGLFWSDGKSGTWSYASVGVDSLQVPKGGWVGFAFQNSSSRTYPGATPRSAPAPRPPNPTKKSNSSSAPQASGPSATAGSGATSSTPRAPATQRPRPSPSASDYRSSAASTTKRGSPTASSHGSDALGWVAAALAIALLLGMWVTLWRRRVAS